MLKKDKLDFRLVNLALIALTVYLVYKTGHLWMGTIDKILEIIIPFVLAFALAYAMHPFVEKLEDRNVKRWLALTIVIAFSFLVVVFICYLFTKVLVGQLADLFDSINSFMNKLMEMDINIDISALKKTITTTFEAVIGDITKYVSDGAIKLIGSSISFLGNLFIGIAAYIYFLIDMHKIRLIIKRFFKRRGTRSYRFIKILDREMRKYLSGLVKIMIISVFEYSIAFAIIGHPYAVLLGFLAGFSNLIPYFGGIAINILAAITAFVVSPSLFIRTLITFFILSSVDSYLINPHVYGKTNSIHPLLTIFALFAGSILFGIMGVFISFPLAIILVTTFNYYKEDILEGFEKIKNNISGDDDDDDDEDDEKIKPKTKLKEN